MISLIVRLLKSYWGVPVLVGTALIVYLVTVGQVYDYDSLFYAQQIENRHMLIHPYHPAQNPLLWLFWQGLHVFNSQVRVLNAGAILSALIMALSLGLLFSILKRRTGSILTALGATAAWGGSYIGWHYATQLETVALTCLAFLITLELSLRISWDTGNIGSRWAAGIATALLPLFHLSMVIYLPLFWTLQLWNRHNYSWIKNLPPLVVPVIFVLCAFLVMPFCAGFSSIAAFFNPLAGQYGGNSVGNFYITLQTWLSGIAYPLSAEFEGPQWLTITAAAVVGLWLSVVIILWIFDLKPRFPRAFLLLIILIPALLFFTWWEPEAIDFASIPVLLIIICAALTPSQAASRQMGIALLTLGIALPFLNSTTVLSATDPANDSFRAATDKAKLTISNDDWILVDPEMIELELKYLDGFENVYVIMSYDDVPSDWLDDFLWGDVLDAARNGTKIWVQGDVLDVNPVLFTMERNEEQQKSMENTLAKFSAYCIPGFSTENMEGRTISFHLFKPPTTEMEQLYNNLLLKERLLH